MKKVLKVIGYFLIAILVIALLTYGYFYIQWNNTSKTNLAQLGEAAPTLSIDGHAYRDPLYPFGHGFSYSSLLGEQLR